MAEVAHVNQAIVKIVRGALLSIPQVHTVEVTRFCVEDEAGLSVCSVLSSVQGNRFEVYEVEATLIEVFPTVMFEFRTRIEEQYTLTSDSILGMDAQTYTWTLTGDPA